MDFAAGHPGLIQNFDTFEAREAAFNQCVGHLLPVRFQGPEAFWSDFSRIVHAGATTRAELPAFITSNPRDGLAFGSPMQVLAAALATAHGQTGLPATETEQIIRQFSLQRVLHQPIRTLSGGETVRLALAKALIAAARHDQLVIASPFCWMAAGHMPLLDAVVRAYSDADKTVRILAMRDEAEPSPISQRQIDPLKLENLTFTLTCRNCRIALGAPVNAVTTQQLFAGIEDADFTLASPCLITGDNGQGKSLLAKALSGAVVVEGAAEIGNTPHQGRARLLFQDVITQALMRSPSEILRGRGNRPDEAVESLFSELLAGYARFYGERVPPAAEDCMPRIKIALISTRLAGHPAVLILDEPDWGLSRSAAIALVLSAVELAHARKVPVIIISHKTWWPPLAASIVTVRRSTPQAAAQAFSISLQQPEQRL